MVDVVQLDAKLQEIIKLKNKLGTMGYDNPKYDELEEELHDIEDDFIDEYGDYLEEALSSVHDEYCPENDVLLPTAYLAKTYKVDSNNTYSVDPTEGVFVDAEGIPGNNTRLVILPNPVRMVLNGAKGFSKVVWTAK